VERGRAEKKIPDFLCSLKIPVQISQDFFLINENPGFLETKYVAARTEIFYLGLTRGNLYINGVMA